MDAGPSVKMKEMRFRYSKQLSQAVASSRAETQPEASICDLIGLQMWKPSPEAKLVLINYIFINIYNILIIHLALSSLIIHVVFIYLFVSHKCIECSVYASTSLACHSWIFFLTHHVCTKKIYIYMYIVYISAIYIE